MKAVKPIFGLLTMALFALLLTPFTGVKPTITFAVLFACSLVLPFVKEKGTAFMAVTVEIWTKDIIENLFKNNEWAKRAFNADQYVLKGKVVHIAEAGTPSTVVKNRDTFPANAIKRTDNEITYAIDSFTTTPRHIEEIEKAELSYDKRQSAVGEDQSYLIETAMDNLLFKWAPLVANTILTAGAATAATVSGGTGNRKEFTKAAFANIKLKMDKANILAQGRVAILTADHYNQFLASLGDAERTDVGRVANLETGLVGKYLGFEIYMRSTVLRYRGANGAYVVVDEQAAGFAASDKTGDRAASLFYQETCVERAKGEVKMFDEYGKAEYYGDIFSFLLRIGGRIRRVAGVYAVVEDLGA